MINLLPQFEKKTLLKVYRLRIGVLILAAILVLELLAVALFFPSFYVLNGVTTSLAEELEQKKHMTPEGESSAQQELAVIKKEIAVLKPGAESIDAPPSVILTEVLSEKPDGIKISTLNYARSAKNAAVQLIGHARTSEDMLLFQKNLKDNPHVASTQYASNTFIIKKIDIDFVMTITLK